MSAPAAQISLRSAVVRMHPFLGLAFGGCLGGALTCVPEFSWVNGAPGGEASSRKHRLVKFHRPVLDCPRPLTRAEEGPERHVGPGGSNFTNVTRRSSGAPNRACGFRRCLDGALTCAEFFWGVMWCPRL